MDDKLHFAVDLYQGTAEYYDRSGLSPDDLTAAPQQRPSVPTFAEYVPVVSATVTGGTRRPTPPTGTGWSSSGAPDAWMSRRRLKSGSSWRTS
jgi:hypothetical protein